LENTENLGKESITKLLMKFSIPAIIAMVINAIYNIVDRVFIGQIVGEQALAGLTIAFPLMMVVFAVAALIGQGGANLISIRLGEKDRAGADHAFASLLVMVLLAGVLLVLLGLLNLDSLLTLLGAEGEVHTFAKKYMSIILIGVIFQMLGFCLSSVTRAEGFPLLSMVAMVIPGVTNMFLDFIFIALLGMGVEGAALATIIGQLIGFLILGSHFVRRKSSLKLHLKDFIPDFRVMGKILSIGSATFVTTIGTSLSMMFLNVYLANYGGTPAVTSMGAINSLYTLFIMPVMGIQGGLQPIIGYNYGAGKYSRVKEALNKALVIGVGFSTVVFLILQLFPQIFIGLFLDKSSDTLAVAVHGLRIFIAMLPLLTFNIFGSAYFQAIASSRIALFLGALRQVFYLLPVLFVLPRFMGLNGVWLATPIADFLAIATTALFLIHGIRTMGKSDSPSARMAVEPV
jgi:putative MATE family efflux protein